VVVGHDPLDTATENTPVLLWIGTVVAYQNPPGTAFLEHLQLSSANSPLRTNLNIQGHFQLRAFMGYVHLQQR
jgi:hypothetical protein